MDLHLEGATRLNASRQDIFKQLTDPRRLADTIPGRAEARVLDGSKVEAKVRLGVPEVEGPFEVEMAVAETDPPSRATLVTKGSGAGSSLKVTSTFDLLGDSPTWMHWTADAEVEGAMAGLDRASLKSFADKEVEEVINEPTRAVERPDRIATSSLRT
jgi:carbon monoxide dehydrogenase subunit G